MKTYNNPIRRIAHLALAALTITAAASVSAQTLIPPNLMAPPTSYNTSSTGMVLRAHQIFAARTPGDQNSLANIQKQLAGVYGANQATNGPLTGGLWSEVYLNHTHIPAFPALGDVDWFYFTAPALPFPGVNVDTNFTLGFTTIAYEIITYLNLPAGTNTLKVGCGDAYKIYIGAGDNPYSLAAASPAAFDGSRGYAVSTFSIDVQSSGVYPVRIIFGQAGDSLGGLQFYSFDGSFNNLINDPSPSGGTVLTSYQPASLPIPAPSLAYVSLLTPVPGETGVSPQPVVKVQLTDGATTTVNTNTISLSFDGGAVSPTITKTGNVTYVSYTVPGLLTNLTTHTAQIAALDSASNGMTNQWSFTVGQFTVVPATWAYPASSGDLAAPGFAGKIHQMVFGANAAAAVGTADAQISGQSGFVNTVVTNGNPIIGGGWGGTQPADFGGSATSAATFNVTNAVNFSINGSGSVDSLGNFTDDSIFPGLPGSQDNTFTIYDNVGELAVEVLGWIQLPAGLSRIGVNNNDTFQLAISPNDARDIFRTSLAQFEGQRTTAENTTATIFVETNGVYSFRLVFRSYRNTAPNQLELFRYDESTGVPVLINGTNSSAVKSYRAVTVPTRPYVKSVTPVAGASGVGSTDPISVVLVNKGNIVPVLKVNGSTVAYTSVTNGSEVTITYTPAAALSGVVNCEVSYGLASGTWSFKTSTGQKAVFISSGVPAPTSDQFVGSRLAAKFGLDVEYVDDDVLLTNTSLSLVSNKVLVVISSTVTGSKPENLARQFMTNGWTIPVIFWEAALADDFGFATGAGSGPGSLSTLDIVNATNALTAGLTNGTYTVYSSGGDAQKYTIPAGYSHVFQAALRTGTPGESRIAGIQKGAVLAAGEYVYATGPITNPSRKVFLGLLGNGSANLLNTNGLALLDAAITWAVQPVLSTQPGVNPGELTVFWSSAGTLQTATNLAAPTWITAPSQANPQNVPTADPQRYYRVKQDF